MTDTKQPTYLTAEAVKNFWLFGMVLLSGASLYFGVSMKVDSTNQAVETLTLAVKEQTEVAKILTTTVNKHETRISLVEEKANACYSYCVAPGRVSKVETSQKFASNDSGNFTPAPTNITVKNENRSEPKDPAQAQEAPKEDQKETIKINLPFLDTAIKIP